eukprot:TRINITY_DN4840_c2_g1_i2.p1 TRINITY_DN4840_c2_g1~~TRINITY_DN4840_c2_g1_i2.p1  ORF type:complete len:1857 (+),score=527.96 TRINITY_DN4840_c2_g1_i2:98-5668(+)
MEPRTPPPRESPQGGAEAEASPGDGAAGSVLKLDLLGLPGSARRGKQPSGTRSSARGSSVAPQAQRSALCMPPPAGGVGRCASRQSTASVMLVSSRQTNLLEGVTMERLCACVPRQLVSRLERCGFEPTAGYEEAAAALLFVDISGFSAVAHLLKELGSSEGAETLSHHLNQHFARLLREVHDHGGDVVLFSGDAMMVSWLAEQTGGPNSDGVRLAVRCADALLRQGEYTFSIAAPDGMRKCTMGVHMGLAAGDVSCLIVGGSGSASHGAWRYLVAGRAVEQAGIAANAAVTGQMVCAPGVLGILTKAGVQIRATTAEVRGGPEGFTLFRGFETGVIGTLPKPQTPPAGCASPGAGSALRGAALGALEEQAKQACSSFVFDTLVDAMASERAGELRTVSTVFIHLTGIDAAAMPPAELHPKLDCAFQIIQRNLTRADGVVNKLVMDDKGLICLCLFGIPRHMHEDDAERAVHVSLRLARRVGKEVGAVSIGISRSKVFCGLTGDEWRREYTVLGDGVNIAARLMQAGLRSESGGVMCDSDTANECRSGEGSGVQMTPAAPLVLKGRDAPVAVYHVTRDVERSEQKEGILGSAKRPAGDDDDRGSLASSSKSLTSPFAKRASNSPPRGSCLRPRAPGSLGVLGQAGSISSMGSISSLGSALSGHRGSFRVRGTRSPSQSCSPSSSMHAAGSPVVVGKGTPAPTSPHDGCSSAESQSPRSSAVYADSELGADSPATREAAARSPLRSRAQVLVGREDELAVLRTLVEQVSHLPAAAARNAGSPNKTSRRGPTSAAAWAGYAKVVSLTGPSQSGKTALARRALETAEDTGVAVLAVAGDVTTAGEDYAGLRAPVREVLSRTDTELVTALAAEDDVRRLSLLQYVTRVKGLPQPDEQVQQLPVREKIDAVNDAVLYLFRESVGWPMVIVADDAHLLDSLTWAFLLHAHRSGVSTVLCSLPPPAAGARSSLVPPGLLVSPRGDSLPGAEQGGATGGTANGTPQSARATDEAESAGSSDGGEGMAIAGAGQLNAGSAEYRRRVLDTGSAAVQLELAPLTAAHVQELLQRVLPCAEADEGLVAALVAKSGGTPGYVCQMATGLVRSGAVELLSDGFAQAVPGVALDDAIVSAVPAVETMVMRSVDRLSDAERRLLTVGGVLSHARATAEGKAAFSTDVAQAVFASDWAATRGGVTMPGVELLTAALVAGGHLTEAAGGQLLCFCKQIYRDVIYRSTLAADRRRLHGIAVRELRSRGADAALLAAHYKCSGELGAHAAACAAAYPNLIRAGDITTALQLLEDAAETDRALASLGNHSDRLPSDERGEIQLHIALCLYETGYLTQAAGACLPLCGPPLSGGGLLQRAVGRLLCCSGGGDALGARMQAAALAAELALWAGDARTLRAAVRTLARLAGGSGERDASLRAEAAGIHRVAHAVCFGSAEAAASCGKLDAPPTTVFAACALFAGDGAVANAGRIAGWQRVRGPSSIYPLQPAPEGGAARLSVRCCLTALTALYCLLSGEGAAAICCATELRAVAQQQHDARWRAYAWAIASIAAGLYVEKVNCSHSASPGGKWAHSVWYQSHDALRTAEALRSAASAHADVALDALSAAAGAQIFASASLAAARAEPYGNSATPATPPLPPLFAAARSGPDRSALIHAAALAVESASAAAAVPTPFHAAAAAFAADAAVTVLERTAQQAGAPGDLPNGAPTTIGAAAALARKVEVRGRPELLAAAVRAAGAARQAALRFPYTLPAAEYCSGALAALRGPDGGPDARRHWQEAQRAARGLGMPFALHAARAQARELLLDAEQRSPEAGAEGLEPQEAPPRVRLAAHLLQSLSPAAPDLGRLRASFRVVGAP